MIELMYHSCNFVVNQSFLYFLYTNLYFSSKKSEGWKTDPRGTLRACVCVTHTRLLLPEAIALPFLVFDFSKKRKKRRFLVNDMSSVKGTVLAIISTESPCILLLSAQNSASFHDQLIALNHQFCEKKLLFLIFDIKVLFQYRSTGIRSMMPILRRSYHFDWP